MQPMNHVAIPTCRVGLVGLPALGQAVQQISRTLRGAASAEVILDLRDGGNREKRGDNGDDDNNEGPYVHRSLQTPAEGRRAVCHEPRASRSRCGSRVFPADAGAVVREQTRRQTSEIRPTWFVAFGSVSGRHGKLQGRRRA